jgi:hypothetical protein
MFFRIHAVRGTDHVEIEFGAHDPNPHKKYWCGPLHRLQADGTLDRLIEDLQRFKARTPRMGGAKAAQRAAEVPAAPAVAEVPQAPESASAVPAAQSGEEVKEG